MLVLVSWNCELGEDKISRGYAIAKEVKTVLKRLKKRDNQLL